MKRFLVLVLATACPLLINGYEKPRVTIITSLFNGDEFIQGFMEDIVRQSIFSSCELILINANSPGNEEPIIRNYMARYPNIIYLKLSQDPGIYAVWNIAISIASADLITNANLDDRRNPQSLEIQANALDQDHTVDLVYGDYLITYNPNETFEHNSYSYFVQAPDFEPRKMHWCLGGPQPMWRKSLHSNYARMFHWDYR